MIYAFEIGLGDLKLSLIDGPEIDMEIKLMSYLQGRIGWDMPAIIPGVEHTDEFWVRRNQWMQEALGTYTTFEQFMTWLGPEFKIIQHRPVGWIFR